MSTKNDAIGEAVRNGEIDKNSPIRVSVFDGPIGGYGFRSGYWTVEIGGIKFQMYHSVSHNTELDAQEQSLIDAVQRKIDHAHDPRYTSQSSRL